MSVYRYMWLMLVQKQICTYTIQTHSQFSSRLADAEQHASCIHAGTNIHSYVHEERVSSSYSVHMRANAACIVYVRSLQYIPHREALGMCVCVRAYVCMHRGQSMVKLHRAVCFPFELRWWCMFRVCDLDFGA